MKRLEQVFEKIGQTPKGVDCPAIDGLIKEADEVAGEVDDQKVLDAAIIGSAQAVEHYEMSRYGTLIAWAEELGHTDVVSLLNANLKEEKAADKKLNSLAEGGVNRRATGARVPAKAPRTKQAAARNRPASVLGQPSVAPTSRAGTIAELSRSLIISCATQATIRTPE